MRKDIESILDPDNSTQIAARSSNGEISDHDYEIIKKHISNM